MAVYNTFSLIESPLFVKFNILLWVEGDRRRAFLALAFISEALEVVVYNVL